LLIYSAQIHLTVNHESVAVRLVEQVWPTSTQRRAA